LCLGNERTYKQRDAVSLLNRRWQCRVFKIKNVLDIPTRKRQLLRPLAMPGFNTNVLETKTDATPSAFDVAGISQAYTVLGKIQLTRHRQLWLQF
jgi:hypothetical protein